MSDFWQRWAALWRRWREDRATEAALALLDPAARSELETLIRLRRDESEFGSKPRSVGRAAKGHVAARGLRAHS